MRIGHLLLAVLLLNACATTSRNPASHWGTVDSGDKSEHVSQGECSDNECITQLGYAAERSAQDATVDKCDKYQGVITELPYCLFDCTPSSIENAETPVTVNCNATCTAGCTVPDRPQAKP